MCLSFFFQAEDGIRDAQESRGLGDVYKRQAQSTVSQHLKALKEAGLIQGEILPPKIKYCINKENWKHAQQLFRDLLR